MAEAQAQQQSYEEMQQLIDQNNHGLENQNMFYQQQMNEMHMENQ